MALEAAVAAQASGSIDAPPGLVLMRPPQMLADVAKGSVDPVLRQEFHRVAVLVETGGFDALELEEMDKAPFLDGAAAIFNEQGELKGKLQQLRRAIDKALGPVSTEHAFTHFHTSVDCTIWPLLSCSFRSINLQISSGIKS